MQNKFQGSKIQAVEISYLTGGCGVSRVNSDSVMKMYMDDLVCLLEEKEYTV